MQVAHFRVQSPLGNLGNIQTLMLGHGGTAHTVRVEGNFLPKYRLDKIRLISGRNI